MMVMMMVKTYLQMPQNLLFAREAFRSIPVTSIPKAVVSFLPTPHMLSRDMSRKTIAGTKIDDLLGASGPMAAKCSRVHCTGSMSRQAKYIRCRLVGARRCAGHVELQRLRTFAKSRFGRSFYLQGRLNF
jgi:hypothetical protein